MHSPFCMLAGEVYRRGLSGEVHIAPVEASGEQGRQIRRERRWPSCDHLVDPAGAATSANGRSAIDRTRHCAPGSCIELSPVRAADPVAAPIDAPTLRADTPVPEDEVRPERQRHPATPVKALQARFPFAVHPGGRALQAARARRPARRRRASWGTRTDLFGGSGPQTSASVHCSN